MKIILKYFCLLTPLILFSCTPECPDIETAEGKGNKVKTSMIECGTSNPVFDLTLNLDVIKNPHDSLDNERYVHIPDEEIQLEAFRDFDYKIRVFRLAPLVFKANVRITEGSDIEVEGTKFEQFKNGFALGGSGPGWTTNFGFIGTIQEEKENNIYQVRAEPSISKANLSIFNKSVANFDENYSLNLLVE